MTNMNRLREIAERAAVRYLRDFSILDLEVIYRHGLAPDERTAVLSMIRTGVRIPAPPRIIRTRDELAALDPDTLVTLALPEHDKWPSPQVQAWPAPVAHRLDLTWSGPVVIIATGDHVRAARQALEES